MAVAAAACRAALNPPAATELEEAALETPLPPNYGKRRSVGGLWRRRRRLAATAALNDLGSGGGSGGGDYGGGGVCFLALLASISLVFAAAQ